MGKILNSEIFDISGKWQINPDTTTPSGTIIPGDVVTLTLDQWDNTNAYYIGVYYVASGNPILVKIHTYIQYDSAKPNTYNQMIFGTISNEKLISGKTKVYGSVCGEVIFDGQNPPNSTGIAEKFSGFDWKKV